MIQYLVILVVTLLSEGCASAADESPFNITTKRDDDKTEVTVRNDKAVISVHSPVGISQAVIERNSEQWPDTVILRLHLKGLEGLKISKGKIPSKLRCRLRMARCDSGRMVRKIHPLIPVVRIGRRFV